MQQYTYPELNNIIEVCLFASNQALEIKKLLSLFAPNSTVMISREDNNTMSWRATESLNENEVNEYSDGDAVIYAMIDKLIIENILLELKQKYTNTPFELITVDFGLQLGSYCKLVSTTTPLLCAHLALNTPFSYFKLVHVFKYGPVGTINSSQTRFPLLSDTVVYFLHAVVYGNLVKVFCGLQLADKMPETLYCMILQLAT